MPVITLSGCMSPSETEPSTCQHGSLKHFRETFPPLIVIHQYGAGPIETFYVWCGEKWSIQRWFISSSTTTKAQMLQRFPIRLRLQETVSECEVMRASKASGDKRGGGGGLGKILECVWARNSVRTGTVLREAGLQGSMLRQVNTSLENTCKRSCMQLNSLKWSISTKRRNKQIQRL